MLKTFCSRLIHACFARASVMMTLFACAFVANRTLILLVTDIVENGKVKNSHVYRGKMEKAFKDYVSDTLKEYPANKKLVSITFTTASEEMKNFAKQLCEEAGFEEIIFEQAGATVSCHCGENCIGIMYQCL